MITAVLYDVVKDQPVNFTGMVDPLVLPTNMNPNFAYFIPFEPFVKLDYDSRYYDYRQILTPISTPHQTYPLYGQWKIEHDYVKRSNADIFLSIESARKTANASLIDFDLQAMAFAVMIKKQDNEPLTPEETQILLDWVTVGNKLIQNKQLEADKKTQVLNGQEPDIDAGWERKL